MRNEKERKRRKEIWINYIFTNQRKKSISTVEKFKINYEHLRWLLICEIQSELFKWITVEEIRMNCAFQ